MSTKRPQLLLQEFSVGGLHNDHVQQTITRLEKSASWKRQRVVSVIPAGASIPTEVYLSHCNLIYPPNNAVARLVAKGAEVGEAYSNMLEQILAHPEMSQWEFLLTIEHDNAPPVDGLLRLLEHMEAHPEFSCISGLYFTKGFGGHAQIWGDPSDPIMNFRPQVPDPAGGLKECNGTGMGFALWRLKMFKDKKLSRPWFVTKKENGVTTQDLYFWQNARKRGYRCAVACDVKVGHFDAATGTMW